MRAAAFLKSSVRFLWVARTVPLPGRARPMASVRQFIELAVNMPEQQPQPGQERASTRAISSSEREVSADWTIASIRSSFRSPSTPASMGPPETKTAGMFSRIAAMSIPGVILSQLLMHTMASALCALTMYSTLSAMISREGREYSIPSCPIAMPSSMAMVLNSAA